MNVDSCNKVSSEVGFKTLLINKCQTELDRNDVQEFMLDKESKLAKCTGPAQKQSLKDQLDQEESKCRMTLARLSGFIGDLYKQHMVDLKTILHTLKDLVINNDDSSLECLCNLLTSVGRCLEEQCLQEKLAAQELDRFFMLLQAMEDDHTLSNRVRSLITEVLQLRRRKWSPKQQERQPKTVSHKEVKRDEIIKQKQGNAFVSHHHQKDTRRNGAVNQIPYDLKNPRTNMGSANYNMAPYGYPRYTNRYGY
ncbi:eukaryotic translation initiation factor 4 gamma 3-like [Penaeus japonicus]|uniref:eukaryotic translation initiation factor 4 gamma 3-like n=1 Tax=Penaeus japonicus TaxID=27405 RepID=UPI001C7150ED|nr:eukaryotic translation initiation factor 4 gamma 3-like [Penaeus japonicus]